MKKLFLSFLFLMLTSAFAGDKIGNGGDGVVCRDGNGTLQSIELLDFFEGRILRGLQPREYPVGKKWQAIFAEWMAELARTSPRRAERYRKKMETLLADSLFMNSTLTDIPDSEHLAFPEGCAVEQVAVQQNVKQFPEDKALLVNQELWLALSERDKAALILHEVIIGEAREALQQDTIGVRYFVSQIAAGKPTQWRTDKDVLLFFRDKLQFLRGETKSGFEIAVNSVHELGGGNRPRFSANTLHFHANGSLKYGEVFVRDLPGPVVNLFADAPAMKKFTVGPVTFYFDKDSQVNIAFSESGKARRVADGTSWNMVSHPVFGKSYIHYTGEVIVPEPGTGDSICVEAPTNSRGLQGQAQRLAYYSKHKKDWVTIPGGGAVRVRGENATHIVLPQDYSWNGRDQAAWCEGQKN